jgi:hypothetical protein
MPGIKTGMRLILSQVLVLSSHWTGLVFDTSIDTRL